MDTVNLLFKCRGCGEIFSGPAKCDPNETVFDIIQRCKESEAMWYAYEAHRCSSRRYCVADFIGVEQP